MVQLQAKLIAKACGGKVRGGDEQWGRGVSTDSRESDLSGKIFIPLKGENFDGHHFVEAAVKKGASIVVVHEWREQWADDTAKTTFIVVDDTLTALQDLGHYWRQQLKAVVIGITGSNGKTTTKDFTAQILQQIGKTSASQGSFNNHWGVPLSLLAVAKDDEYAVIEMGMNHPGELTTLDKIAEPDVVCVTTVGRAHMGFFKDVSEIAKAKEEIYQAAPAKSQFIFNLDNAWTRQMIERYPSHQKLTFSCEDKSADVFLELKGGSTQAFKVTGQIAGESGEAELQFWGKHNLQNLAAAAALVCAAGVAPKKIWPTFKNCRTGWGRNQWVSLESGARVLFDAYNANPDSFAALIENLPEIFPQFKNHIGVFGEMREMGDKAEFLHENLGEQAAGLNWQKMIFFGDSGTAFKRGWGKSKSDKNLVITDTYQQILDLDWASMLSENTLIVVKGSRGQRLERIVEHLKPRDFSAKS